MRILWYLCLVLVMWGLLAGCDDPKPQRAFSLPNGCVLTVFIEQDWEIGQGYYYSVSRNGRPLVPLTYVAAVENTDIRVVDSGEGVVALVQNSQPDEVIILVETPTGESWPFATGNRLSAHTQAKGERLLAVLQAHDAPLRLSAK